jgi:hypothetical protein
VSWNSSLRVDFLEITAAARFALQILRTFVLAFLQLLDRSFG